MNNIPRQTTQKMIDKMGEIRSSIRKAFTLPDEDSDGEVYLSPEGKEVLSFLDRLYDAYLDTTHGTVFVVTRRGYYGSPCRDKSRVAFDLDVVFSTRAKALEYIEKQMREEQAEYLYHVSEMPIDEINRKELVMLQTTLYGLRTYPEGWSV